MEFCARSMTRYIVLEHVSIDPNHSSNDATRRKSTAECVHFSRPSKEKPTPCRSASTEIVGQLIETIAPTMREIKQQELTRRFCSDASFHRQEIGLFLESNGSNHPHVTQTMPRKNLTCRSERLKISGEKAILVSVFTFMHPFVATESSLTVN